MATLRYTGSVPISFQFGFNGDLEPGDEFEVPDELVESYTRRADVEEVEDKPDSKSTKSKTATKDTGDKPAE